MAEKTMAQLEENQDWLGTPPEIADSEIAQTVEADVIVVGAGIAGVAAARSAVEAGASVIIFEKCRTPQGRFGDFAAMNGKTSAKWGRDNIDKEAVVNDLMRDSCFRVDQRILKTWADNAGPDFDWLVEGAPSTLVLNNTLEPVPKGTKCYVQPRRCPSPEYFDNAKEFFHCYQTTVWVRPSIIPMLRENLETAAQKGSLEVYYNTPVRKLLREDGGRVEGLIAQDADGKYIKGIAKKGVVLATGDYSNDRKMLHHYCPWTDDVQTFWMGNDAQGNPSNTGDGHKMGMWVGASMQKGIHAPMTHHMGGVMGVNAYLQLNGRGERFMNEDCPGQQIENQLVHQPGHFSWQFFDSAWPEQIAHMAAGHGSVCYLIDEKDKEEGKINPAIKAWDGYISMDEFNKAVESGSVLCADTIEELVEKTGLPKEKALAEIKRYTELAHKGHDDDFNKTSERLFPLEKGPFYAVRFGEAGMLVCMGGLESDRETHCYDAEGKAIEGLYVAGNVQGNRFSVEYPTTVPGLSHSMALVYGRIAGKNAAEGK